MIREEQKGRYFSLVGNAGSAKLLQAIAPVLPERCLFSTDDITEQSATAYLRCPAITYTGSAGSRSVCVSAMGGMVRVCLLLV